MAKKQTRRSISVSRSTYERLKAFCETQNISMSQFVETRVGDFLEGQPEVTVVIKEPPAPRPVAPQMPRPTSSTPRIGTGAPVAPAPASKPAATPITSAAARYAVEPPPPIIKPKEPVDAKPPTPPTADQIFTF